MRNLTIRDAIGELPPGKRFAPGAQKKPHHLFYEIANSMAKPY
jgi:hypothetical protein